MMKRLVRNKVTGAYLTPLGGWVPDFRGAKDFKDMEAAVGSVQKRHVKNAELVLMMGEQPDKAYDVVLRLFPQWA